MKALPRILALTQFTAADLQTLLSLGEPAELRQLYEAAYAVKVRHAGRVVHLRGLCEISNICRRDCLYCGIRRSNAAPARYVMTDSEVLAAARWAWQAGLGSVALQSGERADPGFIDTIERILVGIRDLSHGQLGVTLSLGEQDEQTYLRWREAGAHRYLLRLETSDPDLYAAVHPDGWALAGRLACLASLRRCGYQVGTGVLIGLPGQSAADLARDVLFMRDLDVDMVGMGPFIPCAGTPLADSLGDFTIRRAQQLELGLKMIACVRLAMPDINIVAATALQALAADGWQRGLRAGANILMPNLTDPRYGREYRLYDGKPCSGPTCQQSCDSVMAAVEAAGERVGLRERGDSPRWRRRRG